LVKGGRKIGRKAETDEAEKKRDGLGDVAQ
jgi:hypothetical protein